MAGPTKIHGKRQIKDLSIDLGRLESDFLNGSSWDITGGNNDATITGLAAGISGDDAVNVDQLNAAIAAALVGAMEYKGTIDVTNPDAQLDGAKKGEFFLVSVGGTLDGKAYSAGDHLVVNDDITDFDVDGAGKIDIIDNTESSDILRQGDIVNDLVTGGVNDVLSAQQGVVLKGFIDALQTELDDTQTGAGLGTDGSYTADGGANYIDTATSLFNADQLLDAQVKANADAIASVTSEVFGELPAVTDGVAAVAPLANAPIAATVRVYLNGLRQVAGGGNDYTLSGSTITFNAPLETGDCVVVDYRY